MPNGEDEERRLLEWLQRPGEEGDPAEDYDAIARAWLSERALRRDDEDVEMLRALGVNRPDRERLRRRRNAPGRPGKSKTDRDRESAAKRIAFYIDGKVDWDTTTADRSQVVAAWVGLSDYNVDRCNEWWRRGVDPLRYADVLLLVQEGLSPTDLLTEVNGRTILQHLNDGTSMKWCLAALDWQRKPPVSQRTGPRTGTGWSA